MPYTRNQKQVLGISDLTPYSMATGSTPLGKEQTSGETQFDSGFLKRLKELITQIIQEECSAGPSHLEPHLQHIITIKTIAFRA